MSARNGAAAHATYDALMAIVREAGILGSTAGILSWDQEVMMPPGGVAARSRALALLARLRHERLTDPRLADLLARCEADPGLTADPLSESAVNLRELRHDCDRMTKLPASLVAESAALASRAQHVWAEARRKSDFSAFRPVLEETLTLQRRKAECYGWPADGEPWDALAEDYEPGLTAARTEVVFAPLRTRLVSLLERIRGTGRLPEDPFAREAIPADRQATAVRFVAESLGFDFARGRLDVSTHPFCSGFNPGDVRLTTRFHERKFLDALGSTIHETGHGLYEQGLPPEHAGTPRGEAVSYAVHESQSRFWENQVGRSRAFWRWLTPRLPEYIGGNAASVGVDEAFAGANRVEPGFIRVEADEVTYNLHIMIRFELERALLRGDLAVADLPQAWNRLSRDFLGLEVPDDARGCLQDTHWAMGAFGYFPTYSLGTMYAAQFRQAAASALGDLDAMFEKGDFRPLLAWARTSVHEHGRRYRAEQLCAVVTGSPLSAEPLLQELEAKFREIYRF